MARQRLDVTSAAQVLGISSDAVRKRAQRGSLPSERDADGHLYIWLDTDTPDGSTPTQAHLDALEDQIAFLRAELERKDHLLAAAIERIPPAIEAPPEPRESPLSAGEEQGRMTPTAQDKPESATQRPWWRRLIGG